MADRVRLQSLLVLIVLLAFLFLLLCAGYTYYVTEADTFGPGSTSTTILKLPQAVCTAEDFELVSYWKSIPEDEEWKSPYSAEGKYLLFEPDEGGWNNLRMGFETVVTMAYATGRTLVLPIKDRIYLLHKGGRRYGYDDFFSVDSLKRKLRVLSSLEFVLEAKDKGEIKIPSEIVQAALAGDLTSVRKEYAAWLRRDALSPRWDVAKSFLAFPSSPGAEFTPDELEVGMKPFKKGHRKPIEYNTTLQSAPLLFFPQCRGEPCRLLIQFYSFLYFADQRTDILVKRLIRDNLHYKEDVLCVAAKIVKSLLEEAQGEGYISSHIRRGDFQYPEARHQEMQGIADIIWKHSRQTKEVLYVSTDETKQALFAPLHEKFTVRFLKDFLDSPGLMELDPNKLGMVEQVVASRGRVFVGTWWSTFTAYINRMRGYNGQDKMSWYYPKNYENVMQTFAYPESLGWWREWPPAWTGI